MSSYTPEQIDTAKNIVLRAIRTERPRDLTVDACKILLSALSPAEKERDALAAYAAKLEKAGDGIRASFTTFNAGDRENALTAWDAARKEKP